MTIKVLKVIGLALLAIGLGFSVVIWFFTFFYTKTQLSPYQASSFQG